MHKCQKSLIIILSVLTIACDKSDNNTTASTTVPTAKQEKTQVYPQARRDAVTDSLHNTTVADPYRWFEQSEDPATKKWIKEQNTLVEPYLENLPLYDAIKSRMTQLWNYERYDLPFKHGKYYFYRRNDGLQDQDVVYVTESLDSEARVLIDPNTLSDDATIALYQIAPSNDGSLVAYSLSDGGSDWRTWHILDTKTGEKLTDYITFTKFTGVSWLPDNSGFYYSRYPAKPSGHEGIGDGDGSKAVAIYLHKIGTAQAADQMVYALPDNPRHNPYGVITEDGKYLVAIVSEGFNANAIHYKLARSTEPMTHLLNEWDAIYDFLGNNDSVFYFRTTNGAPNWRVIGIDVNNPAPENWQEIIPQSKDTLQDATYVGDRFFANYLRDAKSLVQVYDKQGKFLHDIELPGIGSADGFYGFSSDTETFYSFTSFTSPPAYYRYDIETNNSTLFKASKVNADFSQYRTQQVFYNSKDGTRVPMFIIHHKDMELDGSNPTMLYGYGGFDVSLTPQYSTTRIVWLEMGGIVAIPNLRGGGEYGKAWHKAGTKTNKQNVFDDFIAAAEYLLENKYTSSQHLGISGRSNGGLLVGAVTIQRPELFGAALPAVGVLDMLRYHTPSANARAWSSDYGLAENADEFAALYAYSPYHNVKPDTCYPPTLVTTADRDDRVVPWHSYKYVAALQHAQACQNPVMIRIETRAGHGAGKPTWMTIEDYAGQWAFLAEHIGGRSPASH